MCGITGYFTASGAPELTVDDLWRAVVTLKRRGPDDRGVWSSSTGIGLGQTRLSILDLSAHGHQPMRSEDGRWVMVFNGEIYNFAEIRGELSRNGRSFRGTGDSEVVLTAVAEWGVRRAIERFVGMFSIALWDNANKRLTLVRDRLGVKPLYYGWNGRTLWFGSELKALRAYPNWQPRIDRDALSDFFRFSYITDPFCIYSGVSKLRPGHILELGVGEEPKLERYWSVEESKFAFDSADEEEIAEQLESLMSDAFNLRLISDVPVGVFLSGGIDSSLVTALLKRSGPNLRTFTIGFEDKRFNEANYAEQVAKHLKTEHTTKIATENEAMEVLSEWGELFDEPFGDDSGIPTLLVSRLAAQHVKVVLSADGGDELFAGYNSYGTLMRRMQAISRRSAPERLVRELAAMVPWQLLDRLLASNAASANPDRGFARSLSLRLRYLRETHGLSTPGRQFEHVLTSLYWHDTDLDRLLGRPAPKLRRLSDDYLQGVGENLCLWDLDHYLPGDILTKVDRTTMAESIEGREPLLDHRLAEFAFALPYKLRSGALGSKHMLRKILYKHVPIELIERPKKGFSAPIARWMLGALGPLLDEHLNTTHVASQGLLDPDMVQKVRRRFEAGDPYSVQRVWLLLAFQLWHARWMGRSDLSTSSDAARPQVEAHLV